MKADPREVRPLPIETHVLPDRRQAERAVAEELHGLLARRAREGAPCVLGLATGGTMRGVYAELVARLAGEPVDLARLTTFNLDEYLGLDAREPRSFRAFMDEHLFGPLGLDAARCHFPEVRLPARDLGAACAAYEARIAAAGGIDLQLLGLGRNGHVAFNEPGSQREGRTRVVSLDPITREDAAASFGGIEAVPRQAVTMGIGTVLEARRLRVLAFGASKADAVHGTLLGPVGAACPGSYLRSHGDVRLWLDPASAARLA